MGVRPRISGASDGPVRNKRQATETWPQEKNVTLAVGADFDKVLTLAQAGDRGALAEIYRDVAPLVLGYLRANRVDDVEDVAGDVFVSLVSNLGAFSGTERQFRSWLLTIAHRRTVDNVRRRVRRVEDPTANDEFESQVDPSVSLEDDLMSTLRSKHIIDAIDELSALQRSAVMLRVLADLTVPEIARVMGKPESAVKALLRRATANLAKGLSGEGADAAGVGADEAAGTAGSNGRADPDDGIGGEPDTGVENGALGGIDRPSLNDHWR